MERTQLYIQLSDRLHVLEKKFLAPQLAAEKLDPLTFTADLESLAAFRVLAHAEFEDYLERKARLELDKLVLELSAEDIGPNIRMYAMASVLKMNLPHECPFETQRFRSAALGVIEEARSFLSKNNGIKTGTFVVVSLICGKPIASVDSTLSAALSSYGEARGQVAHRSTARVADIRAPSAERNAAFDILEQLAKYFYPINKESTGSLAN
jgi:hypothetical protein